VEEASNGTDANFSQVIYRFSASPMKTHLQTSGIYTEESKAETQTVMCTSMFTAALTTAKSGRGEWTNRCGARIHAALLSTGRELLQCYKDRT
jgi:hypothetical protein